MSDFQDTPYDQLPLNKRVRVLAHNEDGLVALEKPAGAMSHPNVQEENERSLLLADYDLKQECYYWLNDSGETQRAWLINRLDSPTSGVILLGLNPKISAAIKNEFATHRVNKIYYALVYGKPGVPAGSWVDQLKKKVQSGNRMMKRGVIVSAKADYQAVRTPTGGFPITLMKLMPLTGRTHQLRIQCQKHGLPIVGDRTYGNFSFNKEVSMRTGSKRMMLHSAETILKYRYKGKSREFTAKSELPGDFQTVMDYRPGISGPGPKPKRQTVLGGRRFKV